jgi:hypothetical protein
MTIHLFWRLSMTFRLAGLIRNRRALCTCRRESVPAVFDGFTADIPTGFLASLGQTEPEIDLFCLPFSRLPTRGTVSLLGEDTRSWPGARLVDYRVPA